MLGCGVPECAPRRKTDQHGVEAGQPHQLRDDEGEDHQHPHHAILDDAQILGRCERQEGPGHDRARENQQRMGGGAGGHGPAAPDWERDREHDDQ